MVQPKICLLFSWLHILHCTVVGNVASIPSYILLPCVYDTMIMQFYYWLVSYYIYTCINVTCAGTRLYRYTSDFLTWFDTTHTSLFTFQSNCAEGLHFSAFHFISVVFTWLTLCAHARGLQYLSCLSVCVCVCVFSLFWHLAQSGVQTAVSATSARYGHEI